MKFREFHLQRILTKFREQHYPMDVFLSNYFRKNKALGSKDRKYLSEILYEKIKWNSLLEYLKWDQNSIFNPLLYIHDTSIPEYIRFGMPEELYNLLLKRYSLEETQQFCLACNTKAPTTIRVNPLKISREDLFEKWKAHYSLSLCSYSPFGIVFHEKINFFALEEFKQGLFEIQDEASQLIANLVEPNPKDHIIDFCAGAGGKTLAFAPKTNHSGQIYLHDIRPHVLQEAKKRANRAGIQNIQFGIHPRLKGKMDWVLVDVPCSGSGTYRRNPDLKWKFSTSMLLRLVKEQRMIFQEALDYLCPHGNIVYATCSVLPQENEEQLAYFQEQFGLKIKKVFKTFPKEGQMDGFFGAVLKRNL